MNELAVTFLYIYITQQDATHRDKGVYVIAGACTE
jgi:hypothetical protein